MFLSIHFVKLSFFKNIFPLSRYRQPSFSKRQGNVPLTSFSMLAKVVLSKRDPLPRNALRGYCGGRWSETHWQNDKKVSLASQVSTYHGCWVATRASLVPLALQCIARLLAAILFRIISEFRDLTNRKCIKKAPKNWGLSVEVSGGFEPP